MKNRKYFYIICLFLLLGCLHRRTSVLKNEINKNINLLTQHWNTSSDSSNLYLYLHIPLNRFVFKKKKNTFNSQILFSLTIEEEKNGLQVFRKAWQKNISVNTYEETKDKNNFYTESIDIILPNDKYKIKLNVLDRDSNERLNFFQNYDLYKITNMGPLLPFIDPLEQKNIIVVQLTNHIDTLWVRGHVDKKIINNNKLKYIINKSSTIIDSGLINHFIPLGNNNHFIGLPLNNLKQGEHEVIFISDEIKRSVFFNYGNKKSIFWTDDIGDMIEVMKYIIDDSFDDKLLFKLSEEEKWLYIKGYWDTKDPTPFTEFNEILSEFNNRVRFVNNNYESHLNGWKTDRGRIYIIHGHPRYIENSYEDRLNNNYQKWIYSDGKQFVFVSRGISDDYNLLDEIY